MIPVTPWLDRDFAFDTAKFMYPNMVERVRGGPARLEEAVRDLPALVLTDRRDEGWSIQENAGHLLDIEPLMAERLQQLVKNVPVLRAWDGTNDVTWRAAHNSRDIAGILNEFRESRSALVKDCESIPEELIEQSALHPRLRKQMRIIDLVAFIAEHDDYHLARIAAAKRVYGSPLR